jgi:hypothetical protein
MQPIHSVEYELTSELATEIHRTLLRWELRRGWRQDLPVFAGALAFAALIIWLSLAGWILPGVGGGLMCLVMLFVVGAVYRRRSFAHAAVMIPLLALHTSDRRVRIEFWEERVRLETEFFRGEGTWEELDEVVIFARFWVLHLSNGGKIVVPGDSVSPELDALVRAKAQEVMAPVRQG